MRDARHPTRFTHNRTNCQKTSLLARRPVPGGQHCSTVCCIKFKRWQHVRTEARVRLNKVVILASHLQAKPEGISLACLQITTTTNRHRSVYTSPLHDKLLIRQRSCHGFVHLRGQPGMEVSRQEICTTYTCVNTYMLAAAEQN